MPTGETNGELYYKTDDGIYHKLSEITEFKHAVMNEDDKLFNNPSEDPGTVRFLNDHGYFECEMISPAKELMDKITEEIGRVYKAHVTNVELFWIAELAKRYLIEHGKE